ncbi:acyltransferase family protein [Azohydromonas lata]|uniref:acyltransferase family protein n=1 Tax=Azohydromonas lata TaxID=45677 RepID=UPI0008344436|nr:acyltransferase [Azohydromonas lata]
MDAIEGARALAALIVVLLHAGNVMRVDHLSGHIGLGNIFGFGYVGVDFFFVLSGFIITYVHFKELGRPESIPRYLWRRFSRIFPIYWAVLALTIVVATAGHLAAGKGLQISMGWNDIPGTIFLLMGQGEPKYVGVAWSLQYELLFYVLFCLLLLNVRLGAIAFSTWALVILARIFGLVQVELPFNMANAHCLQFLFGVVVGVWTRRYPLRLPRVALPAAVGLFIGAVVLEVRGPWPLHSDMGALALGLASAAVLMALVSLEQQQALRTPAWLARMGSVSYSIYLGHILLINVSYWVMLKLGLYHALPEVLVYALAVAIGLAGTMLLGRCVELPLVSLLKDRMGARPRHPRAVVV